ncbi:hypothetical protein EVAR_55910_1 [Eumeta japonica]|uniref:Uncharacterized protein n=1 Tax=Eumeta variegata TaxID=151549 RepID=A0A4C1YLQ0_EUMVA|nr:hypothetical protein EVAR_55910_1 [Eumeta japonica]
MSNKINDMEQRVCAIKQKVRGKPRASKLGVTLPTRSASVHHGTMRSSLLEIAVAVPRLRHLLTRTRVQVARLLPCGGLLRRAQHHDMPRVVMTATCRGHLGLNFEQARRDVANAVRISTPRDYAIVATGIAVASTGETAALTDANTGTGGLGSSYLVVGLLRRAQHHDMPRVARLRRVADTSGLNSSRFFTLTSISRALLEFRLVAELELKAKRRTESRTGQESESEAAPVPTFRTILYSFIIRFIKNKYLAIILLNAGSLRNKHDEFVAAIECLSVDVMNINEAWLRAGEDARAPDVGRLPVAAYALCDKYLI